MGAPRANSDRLTILHTINGFRWTGVAEPTVQLAREQAAAGHRVVMAVEGGGELEAKIDEAGLEQLHGLMAHNFKPWRIARQFLALRAALSELRPDVVHTHLLHDHALVGLARGRPRPGAPLLVRTFHREEHPRHNVLMRALVRRTEGVIGISQSLGARLRAAFGRTDRDLAIIGGAVDATRFVPGADPMVYRSEWEIGGDAPVVGLLSRLRQARGIFWLLDAAEAIVRRVPDARIVFCGRGRHADLLAERIEIHPMRAHLHYAGYVPPERLCQAYAAFDVHCLLGPGNDGTCRAALESMACARPLIAVDLGALHDLLAPGDGENDAPSDRGGRLVAPGKVEALAETIAYYLSDRELARREGAAARRFVEMNYSPKRQAECVEAFYRRLLAETAAR